MKKYIKNSKFTIGFIMVAFMVAMMLYGFIWIPYDTSEMEITNKLALMSKEHILGTDQFGRDIFSRILVGIRVSFLVGILVVAFGMIVGTLLGSVSGYFGGITDEIVMKLIDTQMAFPGVLLALMLIAVFGTGLKNMIIALGIMAIPRFARMSRSGFVKYRDAEFVKAARARGAGNLRIMFLHIMPNVMPELVVTCSLCFASAVMSEAGLSYLGLGIQPPSPSFGKMLSEAQAYILTSPWYVLIPAGALTILVLGFNLVGDGVQEVNRH